MKPLPALAFGALLLLAPGAPVRGQGEERDAGARAQVDQRLAEWRAGKIASDDRLSDALLGIGRGAQPYLCLLLDSPPPDLPVAPVARALARTGSSQCLPTLKHLAASPVGVHRLAAVEALGILGHEESIPLLASALDDEVAEVAKQAESALLARSLPSAQVALRLSQRMAAAKDKDRPARVLARLGGDNAHEILLRHLDAPDEGEALAALAGLWLLSLPEDGAAVCVLMRTTTSSTVRKQAALFLGRVKCTTAVRDLIGLLREEVPGVAANALWALQQITGLTLKQDANLWEFWWERTGSKLYGPRADPKSRRTVQ